MATLPRATVRLVADGGGVGVGTDLMCIMACTPSGTANVPKTHARVQAYLDDKGYCDAAEFAAHYVELTGKPVMEIKLDTATAGSVVSSDVTGVTGTSVVSFSGAARMSEHLQCEVVTGGTIGTAGIVIRVSRDGGRTWGRNVRLGTANSYVIPNSGVTISFAAGTLVANDLAIAHTKGPMWDAAALTAGFNALAAQSQLPRLVVVIGDITTSTLLQNVMDEISAYETTDGRHARAIVALRGKYPDCAMQGEPSDVDFVAAADTITRNTGSWVADGFKVGMQITIDGTASNDGTHTVVTVTPTVLTVGNTLADEANVNGNSFTITGTEPHETWVASLKTDIVGDSEATLKIEDRVLARAGEPRRKSPLDGFRRQRPMAWASACLIMAHDLHVSEAKVELGPLPGWTITDEDGILETHDERVHGGLLAGRIGCPTTHDDIPGVFSALPLTLDEDNAPLSRAPVGFVGDLLCQLAKRETTRKLSRDVILNADGTITEAEAQRIEEEVLSRLKAAVLTRRAEGQRASDVSFTLARDADLLQPDAEVVCEVGYLPLGYLERITTTVRVLRARS